MNQQNIDRLQSDFELLINLRKDWLKRLRATDEPAEQDLIKQSVAMFQEQLGQVRAKLAEVL